MMRKSRIWLVIGLIVLVALATATYFAFFKTSEQPNKVTEESRLSKPISEEMATYYDKEVGIKFDYPQGLQTQVIPNEELVNSDLYYFGNPRPDFAIEIGADGRKKTGEAYLVALYKKTIAPELLLGNYLESTPLKFSIEKPVIISRGGNDVAGVKYYKLESSFDESGFLYAYELSAVLNNGWTVYLMGLSRQNLKTDIDSERINLMSNKIVSSLKVNEGMGLDTIDWERCENADSTVSLVHPSSMGCELISGPVNRGDSNFSLTGSPATGSGIYKKDYFVRYWIDITKDTSGIDNFLDTEYSCAEGACPVYPVGQSQIKIGGNVFKVSQADVPFGNDPKADIVERVIKLVGKINGNVIYVIQNGLNYKRGMLMPLTDVFSQKVLSEIINSIEFKQR